MKARYRAVVRGRTYHAPDCQHLARWDVPESAVRSLTAADVLRTPSLKPCQTCKPGPPMGLAPEPPRESA